MFLTENGITFKSVPEGWMVMVPGQAPVSHQDLARAVGTLPDTCADMRAHLTVLAWDLHGYMEALPEQPLPVSRVGVDLLPPALHDIAPKLQPVPAPAAPMEIDGWTLRLVWGAMMVRAVHVARSIEVARGNLERLLTAAGGPKGGTRPNAMGSPASNASNGLSKPFAGR